MDFKSVGVGIAALGTVAGLAYVAQKSSSLSEGTSKRKDMISTIRKMADDLVEKARIDVEAAERTYNQLTGDPNIEAVRAASDALDDAEEAYRLTEKLWLLSHAEETLFKSGKPGLSGIELQGYLQKKIR